MVRWQPLCGKQVGIRRLKKNKDEDWIHAVRHLPRYRQTVAKSSSWCKKVTFKPVGFCQNTSLKKSSLWKMPSTGHVGSSHQLLCTKSWSSSGAAGSPAPWRVCHASCVWPPQESVLDLHELHSQFLWRSFAHEPKKIKELMVKHDAHVLRVMMFT